MGVCGIGLRVDPTAHYMEGSSVVAGFGATGEPFNE